MTFDEILKNRRSIRNYQDKPVSLELVKELIKESTLAPSAGNEQPWEFIIVNNKEFIKRMSEESKKNILSRIAADPNDYAIKYKGMLENKAYNVFYNAPCAVVILGQSGLRNLLVDCALAASYFMMAATSRGLGTCWVNLGMDLREPEILNKLTISDNYKIVALLALGYPAAIPAAPKREEPKIIKIITEQIA